MKLEFLKVEASKAHNDVKKYHFLASEIVIIHNFLENFLINVHLMGIVRITDSTRVGIEIYTNTSTDLSRPLYLPFRKRVLIKNVDLTRELKRIEQSSKHFLDTNIPFEIVVSTYEMVN